MSGLFRAIFIFTSFLPLYLLLAASLYVQGVVGWWIALVVAVVSLLAFGNLTKTFKRKSVFRSKVEFRSRLDENIYSYLISFLPPLMVDDFSNQRKLVPVIGFYAMSTTLLFLTRAIYINPMLILFGFRIYSAKLGSAATDVVIITKIDNLILDDVLDLYEIQNARVYFAEQRIGA